LHSDLPPVVSDDDAELDELEQKKKLEKLAGKLKKYAEVNCISACCQSDLILVVSTLIAHVATVNTGSETRYHHSDGSP